MFESVTFYTDMQDLIKIIKKNREESNNSIVDHKLRFQITKDDIRQQARGAIGR